MICEGKEGETTEEEEEETEGERGKTDNILAKARAFERRIERG